METALHEPAILYCIFGELPPQDLLIVQRVCLSWRGTITSDNRLLARLWLRPSPSEQKDRSAAPPQLNPLLQHHFPYFFKPFSVRNFYLRADNLGPWFCSALTSEERDEYTPAAHMPRLAAYMRPEASWQRMIPCRPCPVELQLDTHRPHVRGTVNCLTFTNEVSAHLEDATIGPPWLTFGLLYDIIEASWFRGIPKHVYAARFDYSYVSAAPTEEEDAERYNTVMGTDPYRTRALIQSQLGDKQISGPGRLFVSLTEDLRRPETRARDWEEMIASQRIAVRNGRHRSNPFKATIFTHEFHVRGGLAMADIDWDEVYEYGLPPQQRAPALHSMCSRRASWLDLIGLCCCLLCCPCRH